MNKTNKSKYMVLAVLLAVIAAIVVSRGGKHQAAAPDSGAQAKPALTVTTIAPQKMQWSERVTASGPVLAWQEAIIGPEVGGVRVIELGANVGEQVRKGQLLARLSDATLQADAKQQQAAFDEANARYHEAEDNAQRAANIKDAGVLSAQELLKFSNAAEIAKAQMEAALARWENAKLKLSYTRVEAPDDGLISARSATVGSVAQIGAEMFRLIRQDRLEWRAELSDQQLRRVRVGQAVSVSNGEHETITGAVARIAPSVDMTTRNGYVYISLPENKGLRAGMFTDGEFELGQSIALTVPQSAVVMRDGYGYVFRVGKDARVMQTKVELGRRRGDKVEVVSGLAADAELVASGTGFLNDGDLVRIEANKSGTAAVKPANPAAAQGNS